MTTITPFKSHTGSLFGVAHKPQADRIQVQVVAAVAPSPRTSVAATSPSATSIGNASSDVYKDPEFMKDPAAAIARSEADFAAWEAKEQQFEQENGFRRKVNSMALGSYAKA